MKTKTILIFLFFLSCVKTEIDTSKKLPLNFIGDSLTAGTGASDNSNTYPAILSKYLPNRVINNTAIGGQNAQQIASRQGGLPIFITLAGNSFAGSNAIFL